MARSSSFNLYRILKTRRVPANPDFIKILTESHLIWNRLKVEVTPLTSASLQLKAFPQVTYDETSETAKIVLGLIWSDFYAALEPQGVTVVGGRVTSVRDKSTS